MNRRYGLRGIGVSILTVLLASPAAAEGPRGQELINNREGHVVRPGRVAATERRIRQLQVPEGFAVNVYADGLGAPRMLAVAPDGTVYVTRRASGDVVAMRDEDGDGAAERVWTAVKNIPQVHGITIHGGQMFLADVHNVYVAELRDGDVGEPERIIEGLPPGGRHPNRTLAVGPDTRLYITVGSTCNCCLEKRPESATVLRANLDGSDLQVFANGLRNTLGIGWHPQTAELWGIDNGTDWLGDREPPEELNRLREGEHYGWPFVNGKNELINLTNYPEEFESKAWLEKSTPSVLEYVAHSAPLQLAFYTAEQFPAEYRNDAFVSVHGSWNRRSPVGYEIVHIRFDEQGAPVAIEPFLTGFLLQTPQGEWASFGRPAGITVATDGALLFSDDENGVLYRVTYANRE